MVPFNGTYCMARAAGWTVSDCIADTCNLRIRGLLQHIDTGKGSCRPPPPDSPKDAPRCRRRSLRATDMRVYDGNIRSILAHGKMLNYKIVLRLWIVTHNNGCVLHRRGTERTQQSSSWWDCRIRWYKTDVLLSVIWIQLIYNSSVSSIYMKRWIFAPIVRSKSHGKYKGGHVQMIETRYNIPIQVYF